MDPSVSMFSRFVGHVGCWFCARVQVEVDLSLSAHANAAQHFSARKKSSTKQHKTLEATGKVMKQAERRAAQDAAKVRALAPCR